MFFQLTLAIMILGSWSGGIFAAETRCERLFKEAAGVATCNTISGLYGDISDQELRERVSKTVYGVGASELDKELEKREMERKRKEADDLEVLIKTDQCFKLFDDPLRRETCRTLRMLTYRNRTDHEMREDVEEYISSNKRDSEKDRKAAVDAELKRRDHDAWLERKNKEDDEKRAAQIEREKRAASANAQKKKADAIALDTLLSQGVVGFSFRAWEKGGFGTVLIIEFILQNNSPTSLKDFEVTCNARANSDTLLSAPRKVLYERLRPGARAIFNLNMGIINSQTARVSCGVSKWVTG